MSTRMAFRIFMRFQLEQSGLLSDEDIDSFIMGIEDDPKFYKQFDDFLEEYIDMFGENYDVELL